MEKIFADVADMIFDRKAFKFGKFRLKLHEENPNAPLSPFFINIRNQDNPTKKGTLIDTDYDLIAKVLLRTIQEQKLNFQAIAGIPHAADSIIEAIARAVPEPRDFRIIKLDKEVTEDKRKIIPLPGFNYQKGEEVLVLDDLVTKAHSKIEAIKAIESEGSLVKNLLVLVDREQGGEKQLEEAGYNLFATFSIIDILYYYVRAGKISEEKYVECVQYIENNS